jgi:hypothetical protein
MTRRPDFESAERLAPAGKPVRATAGAGARGPAEATRASLQGAPCADARATLSALETRGEAL